MHHLTMYCRCWENRIFISLGNKGEYHSTQKNQPSEAALQIGLHTGFSFGTPQTSKDVEGLWY